MLPPAFVAELAAVVGAGFVRQDEASREAYGEDCAEARPPARTSSCSPGSTSEVAAHRGGLPRRQACRSSCAAAAPGTAAGPCRFAAAWSLSMERFNRILEIDEANLLAVVEPNVITGDLQDAGRAGRALLSAGSREPATSRSIGGNVAECAGGPRAFKYGTTKRYVLGLEAVLPTGEIVRTGSKAVKNVVGYDLTQLLVGSEGTLAIITQIVLRLIPKPPAPRDAARDVRRRSTPPSRP